MGEHNVCNKQIYHLIITKKAVVAIQTEHLWRQNMQLYLTVF